ncbi:hypothetical protein FRB94_008796 [Tulasnella sp. JGI-2019a]|nr:hypothetical protein FRB94_008796 [Tulasnella sp. JGI-2019a]
MVRSINPITRRDHMPPPSVIPAQAHAYLDADATEFYTARSRPEEENAPFLDTQPEEAGSQDPFDHLWGRLVPCNPQFEAFDLLKDQPTVYIGRNPTNNLVLSAPKISGKHCVLEFLQDPDGSSSVCITDLSSNGTYISGTRLGRGRNQRLMHGDEICLGMPISSLDNDDFRYIFRLSSSPITTGAGIHSQYQLGDILGTGTFATVRKAYSKVSKDVYACKIMVKSRLQHNPKQKEYFERELAILQTLRHYNITKLHEYFEDEATIFIVMEFCAGGDLLSWIQKHGAIGEEQSKIWSAQMMDAIEYTHKKKISHRDLKPENILLTSGLNPIIKVADFGLAKQATGGTFLHTMCGTPQYLAPEVVTGAPNAGYDSKVDAYSLGVIIWSMLTNVTCFGVEDESLPWSRRMANRQVDWSILAAKNVSEMGEDFLRRLIVHNPVKRMSVKEARRHSWLAGVTNTPPIDYVPSQNPTQSQSQSQHWSSQGSAHDRAGTEELGEPIGSTSTDPYDYADSVGKGADGLSRWGSGGRRRRGGTAGQSSRGEMSGSSGVIDTSTGGVMDMDIEEDQDQDQGLSSGTDEITTVGTPPKRKGAASPAVMDVMSWEHIPHVVPPATAAIIEKHGDNSRPVKPAPKPRRKAGDARTSETINNNTTVTPKNNANKNVMYDLAASASTTVKRKAHDVGSDSELSSVTPSEDEREDGTPAPTRAKIAKVGGKDLDAQNRSFSTTSSNSTIRGGNRSKRNSVDVDATPVVAPPTTRLRNPTGAAIPAPRASARLRQASGVSPAIRAPKTTEKRTRIPGRFRAPSGSSDEDEDEEKAPALVVKAGPSTRTTRKTAAIAAPPPTTTAAARRTRNGGTTAKAPRLR